MPRVQRFDILVLLPFLVANALASASLGDEAATNHLTALDLYVAAPDDSYRWSVHETLNKDGFTVYVVDLKSQTWRTKQDVNRTLWQHWLVVIKPPQVRYDKALVFIGGGRNGGDPPSSPSRETMQLAAATGSVVAELRMIPNQPLVFHDDGQDRKEDDLIAYTWDQYMKTGDDTWPARLPMVKSVVRAMDTIESLMASDRGGNLDIEGFVVAGGSKRGWTTWMTAAVDDRVEAIIPIVIDVLNVDVSMKHHYAAYGFWAPAINDYVRHKIPDRMDTPESKSLMKLVDPYFYRQRFTMPKFIVNSAGDQFFLPDSSQFYFDDLPGEKHLRYVPNSDHSLRGTDALESIATFHELVLSGTPRPEFSWTFPDEQSIRVSTQSSPVAVKMWQAANTESRDFRLDTIGPAYRSRDLEPDEDGSFTARVSEPPKGWTAYFAELTFDVGTRLPLKLTTPVRVVPDVLPFKDKKPPAVSR